MKVLFLTLFLCIISNVLFGGLSVTIPELVVGQNNYEFIVTLSGYYPPSVVGIVTCPVEIPAFLSIDGTYYNYPDLSNPVSSSITLENYWSYSWSIEVDHDFSIGSHEITGYFVSGWPPETVIGSTEPYEVMVNNHPPQVFDFFPDQYYHCNIGDEVEFSTNCDDIDTQDLTYFWFCNNELHDEGSANTSVIFNELGLVNIELQISDNIDTTFVIWEVDVHEENNPPEIISIFPEQNEITLARGFEYLFNFELYDNDSDSISYTWLLYDHWNLNNDSAELYYTFNQSGHHTISVIASDPYYTLEHTWDVNVIFNPTPSLISYSPEEQYIYFEEERTLDFNLYAEDLDSLNYIWVVNDEEVSNNANTFSYYFEEGYHEVACQYSDLYHVLEQKWFITIGDVSNSENNDQNPKVILNNYPNPFNPSTTISYSVEKGSLVDLSIYNIKGQLVKNLIRKYIEKGDYTVIWNGIDETGAEVCSGVYFYKLDINNQSSKIKKCLLLK